MDYQKKVKNSHSQNTNGNNSEHTQWPIINAPLNFNEWWPNYDDGNIHKSNVTDDDSKKSESKTINNSKENLKANPVPSTSKEEKKVINISRGILQFVSEGGFQEGALDVRKPHYPQDVAVFKKLTEDEKKEYKTKEKSIYKAPNSIGVFRKDVSGEYGLVKIMNRHSTETYKKDALSEGEELGAMETAAGSNSGLTIGMGLDVGAKFGNSKEAEEFFIKSELDKDAAKKLATGAGIKGLKAGEKAAELRDSIVLSYDNVIKMLDVSIPDYDTSYNNLVYKRGSGSFHPAIEEALMNIKYWGNKSLWKSLYNATVNKKPDEQILAAKEELAKLILVNSDGNYKKYYHYFEILEEMILAGNEVVFSEKVESVETLTGETDDTFELVQDIFERKEDYKYTKDLKQQIKGKSEKIIGPIKETVGEKGKNTVEDVTSVQQLLLNGNYKLTVTGIYDEETKAAIKLFMKTEGFTGLLFKPNKIEIRTLKKFKHKQKDA